MTASTLPQAGLRRQDGPVPAPALRRPGNHTSQATKTLPAETPLAAPASAGKPVQRSVGDLAVCLAIAALAWAAWLFTKLKLFDSGDDVGYWLGVAGGVMMLLLFTYPMRKHLRFTHRWGKVKWWFVLHMLLGVGGPLLILLHSNFDVRSLNAGVAFYSMVIVAISGVVGRFIYSRVNRGMHGQQMSFRELQERAGLHQREAESRLTFAPAVEERMHVFGRHEHSVRPGLLTCIRRVFWLPVAQWFVYRACVADLRAPLEALAELHGLDDRMEAKRARLARKLVRRYLQAVVRVAQYTAYERLFSLWHVAHLPFVFLLLLSALVHVVAVHAY
jgi:hypothetical protein